jgi:hypothetical protein
VNDLVTLKNILAVLIENGVHNEVTQLDNAVLFEGVPQNVIYKDDLVAAGATYDSNFEAWMFWGNEE